MERAIAAYEVHATSCPARNCALALRLLSEASHQHHPFPRLAPSVDKESASAVRDAAAILSLHGPSSLCLWIHCYFHVLCLDIDLDSNYLDVAVQIDCALACMLLAKAMVL